MNISNATIDDIPAIARIHQETFKDFFLSSLGENFLNTYYLSYFNCSTAIFLVVKEELTNELVGFAAGTIVSKGFHKKIIQRNIFKYLISGIVILFSKPLAFLRIIRNLEKKAHSIDNGNYSELLSIAIQPKFAGKGIGKFLLQKFEEKVKSKGSNCLALTTDHENNENTVKFYESCGYNTLAEFIAYPNRKMFKLIKTL